MRVEIPLRLGRGLNDRRHYMARARAVAAERFGVGLLLANHRREKPPGPWVVTLTRCAPSSGLDSDNLQGALKAVRDEVAEFLGVDDGGSLVRWEYAQRRAPWNVEILIETESGDA